MSYHNCIFNVNTLNLIKLLIFVESSGNLWSTGFFLQTFPLLDSILKILGSLYIKWLIVSTWENGTESDKGDLRPSEWTREKVQWAIRHILLYHKAKGPSLQCEGSCFFVRRIGDKLYLRCKLKWSKISYPHGYWNSFLWSVKRRCFSF